MPAGRSIDAIAEQPEKVIAPRLTGPAGSVIDVNDEQPSKSERAPNNLVKPAGSVTDVQTGS